MKIDRIYIADEIGVLQREMIERVEDLSYDIRVLCDHYVDLRMRLQHSKLI